MRVNPVDLGRFIGVIYLHFSKLIITMYTLLDAVLLARTYWFLILSSTSKDVNVAKFSYFEVCTHMAKSFLFHGT